MEQDELVRGYGQQRKSAALRVGKLNLKRRAFVGHHHRADLPAAQRKRRSGDKMLC